MKVSATPRYLLLLSSLASVLFVATAQDDGFVRSIKVKLLPGTSISDLDAITSTDMVQGSFKSFTLPDETLDNIALTASANSGTDNLPDLKLWYTLVMATEDTTEDIEAIFEQVQANESVDYAEVILRPPPPPRLTPEAKTRGRHLHRRLSLNRRMEDMPNTPDFMERQGYLLEAPNGINAIYGWTFLPGGTGDMVKVYDVEYAWNLNHEDLNLDIEVLVGEGLTPVDPFRDDNHGTAVLGELVADDNGLGVMGICFGSEAGVAAEWTNLGSMRGDAIMNAVNDGTAGDIILLEMQYPACGGECGTDQIGCGPAEESLEVFEATQMATASGFIVVAAAGNGEVNLDDAACEGRYDPAIRDSGAIIVGAGAPTREKLSFSSFGSRVDVQGWGTEVVTTGYGNLFSDFEDPSDEDRWYTSSFGGTSGASPIVTGAAAIMQSYAKARHGTVLTPAEVRSIFRETGSPQQGNTDENIGNLPNLIEAICAIDTLFSVPCEGAPAPMPQTAPAPLPAPIPAPVPAPVPAPAPAPLPQAPVPAPAPAPSAVPVPSPTLNFLPVRETITSGIPSESFSLDAFDDAEVESLAMFKFSTAGVTAGSVLSCILECGEQESESETSTKILSLKVGRQPTSLYDDTAFKVGKCPVSWDYTMESVTEIYVIAAGFDGKGLEGATVRCALALP